LKFVPEYAPQIFEYMKETEQKYAVTPNYMVKQPDITAKMREILVSSDLCE
jgi:hypothetical protein